MKSSNSDLDYKKHSSSNPYQQQSSYKSHKKQFSFQKNNIMITGSDYIEYENYYISIKNKLKQLQISSIIDTAIEWLKLNDKLHSEFCVLQQENSSKDEEIKLLKQALQKKRQAFQQIIRKQQKNRNLIEKLQTQLQSKGKNIIQNNDSFHCNKCFGIQMKYKQLSKYMNEYIHQTNEVQQEFKRNYTLQKKQNQRLLQKYDILKKSLNESNIKNKLLQDQLQKSAKNINLLSKITHKSQQEHKDIDKDLNNLHQNIKSSIVEMYKNNQIHKQSNQQQSNQQIIQYQSSISQAQAEQIQHLRKSDQQIKGHNQQIKSLQEALDVIKQIQTQNKYLTTQIIKLKYNLKRLQKQIECNQPRKQHYQNEIFKLKQEIYDIRKQKNDQTQSFLEEIQHFQKQNKVLRDQIQTIKKNKNKQNNQNKSNNHNSNQNQIPNDIQPDRYLSHLSIPQNQIVRNHSQKSIKKPYVYVPPLNLSSAALNKPLQQIQNNSSKHKNYQIAFSKVKF